MPRLVMEKAAFSRRVRSDSFHITLRIRIRKKTSKKTRFILVKKTKDGPKEFACTLHHSKWLQSSFIWYIAFRLTLFQTRLQIKSLPFWLVLIVSVHRIFIFTTKRDFT